MPAKHQNAAGIPFRGNKKSKRVAWLTPAKQDATSTRNQAKSPLLQLPPELRNQIFEHALAPPEGLHHRFAENTVSRLYSKLKPSPKGKGLNFTLEANQLKYTCRQLCWAHPSAADQAIAFLSQVNPQRLKWLHHVTIALTPCLEKEKWAAIPPCLDSECEYPDCMEIQEWQDNYRSIPPLLKFARLHPDIQFDFTIMLSPHDCPRSVPSTWPLVTAICSLLIAFRDKEQEVQERRFWDNEDGNQELKKKLQDGEQFEVLDAANVHFRIPKDWFDETFIRMDCETQTELEWVEDYFAGGVDGFVDCVRLWVEDGF
ncbi:hypothetical protein CC86DRAFT_409595 [Ophiobolus disseminans]|uniref:Uncharacterized protein n=1 Tax=Ophiobolus disseminans TaxID=1469910 RepID=A0A6A6ZR75_9PLEO|nr:hypothetical protein CC86DRAFT_409595 [Ophiobolus disseminans]